MDSSAFVTFLPFGSIFTVGFGDSFGSDFFLGLVGVDSVFDLAFLQSSL